MADLLEILRKEARRINITTGEGKPINLISQETFIDTLNNHKEEIDYELNKAYGRGYLHVFWHQKNYFCAITPMPLRDL
jgi:hypothetical protein